MLLVTSIIPQQQRRPVDIHVLFLSGCWSSCSLPKRRKDWALWWCWCWEDRAYYGTYQQRCQSSWLVLLKHILVNLSYVNDLWNDEIRRPPLQVVSLCLLVWENVQERVMIYTEKWLKVVSLSSEKSRLTYCKPHYNFYDSTFPCVLNYIPLHCRVIASVLLYMVKWMNLLVPVLVLGSLGWLWLSISVTLKGKMCYSSSITYSALPK